MANLTNLTYDNSINTAMVRHTPWPQYVLRSISPADPAVQFCPKHVGAIAHHTRVINLSSPSLTPTTATSVSLTLPGNSVMSHDPPQSHATYCCAALKVTQLSNNCTFKIPALIRV